MGQYQQWLHYREIDQQLHTRLEQIKHELSQLEEQARVLRGHLPTADNVIIQALVSQQRIEILFNTSSEISLREEAMQIQGQSQHSSPDPSVDFPWNHLASEERAQKELHSPPQLSPVTPFLATEPPEESAALFDNEQTITAPQLELPWWMRKTVVSTASVEDTIPVDQQSIRTNQSVQRWFERWGRRSNSPDTPHEETNA